MHLTPPTQYIFHLILGSPTSERVGGVVVFHPYSAAADMIVHSDVSSPLFVYESVRNA
ncbi:hypothetical protein B0H13DRAFT_2337256 [Mycena leptocephala]|nr:hypothetical protein B0H13DRAFT_2337256 [Mycena leptocephala]